MATCPCGYCGSPFPRIPGSTTASTPDSAAPIPSIPAAEPRAPAVVVTNEGRSLANPIDVIAQAVRSGRSIAAGFVADEIVAALAAAGWAIVPAEATDNECIAGLQAGLDWMKECGVTGLSPFADYPSPTETTRRCWRAMVDAGRVKP